MDPNTNPQQQYQQPQQPAMQQPDPKRSKKLLVWGIVCLVGPTALIIMSILIYVIAHFTLNLPSDDVATKIINIVMYLVGIIATLTWLPGIIAGSILLSKRK